VLVGRDTELAVLDALVAQTAAGAGGIVLLTGEPGVGKHTIAREMHRASPSAFPFTVIPVAEFAEHARHPSGGTLYLPGLESLPPTSQGRLLTALKALDRDTRVISGTYLPIRSSETFVELTYQYQVAPWCQLQPDFQYVFNPGAGVLNPNAPGQRVKNEAVLGIRAIIQF
jgi:hypothetical protein